ncbi:hypothetical protein GCM10007916_36710 [Psychromonas marina]|uniref:Type 4 fimbrial biogenesis protein PilX N-terminal domain-containing protein n=1 Tax=Psychromonas marina TaxID=88364 RepID=A0ABQ6E5A4_9GAMM|nr:PilX N-terminal domain-containing pilus assembly protein [Psychromonas marina]GLS92599.1 hypothetical protein GCM10007916_36710 [Psychromonas marina]
MFKKQSGAVLIISLITLIILTLLVVSGSQSTLVQNKMTSAIRDTHVSLQIAESGVRDAEKLIEALTGLSEFTSSQGINGKYSENAGPSNPFLEEIWGSDLTSRVATTEVSGHLSRYFIEYLGLLSVEDNPLGTNVTGYGKTSGSGDIHGFKIVARSVGRDGNTERIIVSYYGKRF